MNALVEGHGSSEQRFQRHCARDVGESCEPRGSPESQRADSGQRLRSVEQREPFLTFEVQRVDRGAAQRLASGQPFSTIDRLALADRAQREVRERREIPAGADGALLRNHRVDTAIQHLYERQRHQRTHTAIAERQRVGAQRHHHAGLGFGERASETARVAAHQVKLQAIDGVVGNAHFAELAEARIDAVNRQARFRNASHHLPRRLHLGDSVR